MTHPSFRSLLTACALSTLSAALWAQNLAIVNGKAVPKARAEVLAKRGDVVILLNLRAC